MSSLQTALTFDDVLIVPRYSAVLPKDVSLQTRLSRRIKLNIPLLSAAMDTVTEANAAIAIAQEGGIGIIHKNMVIEQQAAQVRQVKRFASGIVKDPIVIQPEATIAQLRQMMRQHHISGVPVTEGEQLVGIVTARDVRFEDDPHKTVASVMTPKERLVTAKEGADNETILGLLQKHRIEKLLIVNDHFQLRGMITVQDMQKAEDKPQAAKDSRQHLLVGAAVGTGTENRERAAALVEAGVDVLALDTAHAHSQGVIEQAAWLKKQFPDVEVIGGNIATGAAAKALLDAGIDAVKVGIGPGSICTTRAVSGVGMPQVTAIQNVAAALQGTDVPVIADGGIRYSGDIAKAIVAGAATVMIGSLFAGAEESPGEVELFQGRSYKSYRGMGSLAAMAKGSSDRYFQDSVRDGGKLVPEGVEGRVPYKGSLVHIVHQLLGGLRAGMGYTGCANIHELQTQAELIRITGAGVTEGHVHDVVITKEAPNYQRA